MDFVEEEGRGGAASEYVSMKGFFVSDTFNMHVDLTKAFTASLLGAPILGVMGRSRGGGGAATAEIWQEIKRIKLIRAVAVLV